MRDPILNATLNLTQACNMACSYCFNLGKTSKRMSLRIAKKCVDFLLLNAREADEISLAGRARKILVAFWGGEPLLEWDLLKRITLYAERVHGEIPVEFGGTTNGTLYTEEKLGFLADHRIPLLLSFDGTDDSHNAHRRFSNGMGSHETIAKNIERALKIHAGLRVRMSPFAERIDHFYEDVRYIVGLGINNLMFSPVYESGWTQERWAIFKAECDRVADFILDEKKKGIVIDVSHYKSFAKTDDSRWPCGAGRFYVGFDVDGAIYPCHRFVKFPDQTHWSKRKVCLGHVDYGITNPGFRSRFIHFRPGKCRDCEYDKITPCHGGCYAVNHDLTGDIAMPPDNFCEYTKMQSGVSRLFREKYGPQGFPEAVQERMERPKPEGILNVILQMDRKISAMEKLLGRS